MSHMSDTAYVAQQYENAANLTARIDLHRRFSTNHYGWHPWVFDQLTLPAQCRVLELGCGSGELWVQNAGRLPPGWDVTLSDSSAGMLREAQHNLQDRGLAFRFAVIDAQAIPCEDSYFDAVIANHMLYHVPDRPRALAEIQRVLRPGGRLFATTIGRSHLKELNELLHRVDPTITLFGQVGFSLEDGMEQLVTCFSDVTLTRYPDSLAITEAEPLVAFILSTHAKSLLTPATLPKLIQYIEQDLATHGTIHVTKDSGIFTARRAAD